MTAATAIWLAGEAVFSASLAIAGCSIVRDIRSAWPRIVALWKGEE